MNPEAIRRNYVASRRVYSRDEKVNILARLQANGGNIILTAAAVGVPERTLYTWRRQFYAENQRRQSPPPSSPMWVNDFADDLEVLAYVRRKIVEELLSVAHAFDGNPSISPAQRMNLLSQLMDRIIKLDEHLKPYRPTTMYRPIFGWYAGLYIRSQDGYRGPFTPAELHPRWKQKYGEDSRLEIFWGDDTFSLIPEGMLEDVRDFNDDPCPLAEDDLDEEGYPIKYGENQWGGMPGVNDMPLLQRGYA